MANVRISLKKRASRVGAMRTNTRPERQANQAGDGRRGSAEEPVQSRCSWNDLAPSRNWNSVVYQALRLLFPGHTLNLRCTKSPKFRDHIGNCFVTLELRKEVWTRYKLRSHWLRDGVWCTGTRGDFLDGWGRAGGHVLLPQITQKIYFL